jgi:triosephosphate isomerase
MYLTANQARSLAQICAAQLNDLCRENDIKLVLCPSAEAINGVVQAIADADALAVGAQDCASEQSGAFTGQVAAASLKEIGCAYVIIGHSELRVRGAESDDQLEKKLQQALAAELTPIFCIGETLQEKKADQTNHVIKEQLAPLKKAMASFKSLKKAYIAYEPVWAIGSGLVPDAPTIENVCAQLDQELQGYSDRVRYLYGGSVDADAARWLWQVPHLAGLLVGKASTDFQLLKKIVGYKQ